MFDFFKKDKTPPPEPEIPQAPTLSWTERLKQGLSRTRSQLGSQLTGLFSGGRISEEVYEELETILLTADVGVPATQALLEQIRSRVKRQNLSDTT
ncbi:MAG TPA: signal recognition particle receptor subunit alpha, partial [Methylophilaceae bacterium]|nr:signal recognition particle receptor subunit alpha [Methylophilaceae bacterium]